MNDKHHESGEAVWCDGLDNWPRTVDELSREEVLRSLAGLDERFGANRDEEAYSLLARGLLHSRLGDDRRAAEDFSRAIKLEPDNTEALENRPAARDALGERQLAREDYGAVIRLEPDNAVALYTRGACLAQLGDLARAFADFERAIALETGDPVAYFNRGCTRAGRWRTTKRLSATWTDPWPSGPTTLLPSSPEGWPASPLADTKRPSKTSGPPCNSNRTPREPGPSGPMRSFSAFNMKRQSRTSKSLSSWPRTTATPTTAEPAPTPV